ncbi:hypothetical protein RO575_19385 [Methylomonas sp. MO1]|uniref:hypothetical protein n=1 Tax=unclassified Methylomonas TaxID=2608980 RepID=UPI00047BB5CC|nr:MULTISPECIES: hypothetical protein [unclassified Methylomonas]MDT4291733.1 hypothetical protein [Methylomonas sp. MO1]
MATLTGLPSLANRLSSAALCNKADSVADNVGLNARQRHLILVEICADCWFTRFRLRVATAK